MIGANELRYLENCVHCLSHIESVPPVVVHHRTVVLLYRQNPATKNLVDKTETFNLTNKEA